MEDYSFLQDLLETWRATSDWVKVVVITAIPGQVIFLIYQVLRHRAEQREDVIIDARVRSLARAEMCRIVAEWERARLAQEQKTGDAHKRLSDATPDVLIERPGWPR